MEQKLKTMNVAAVFPVWWAEKSVDQMTVIISLDNEAVCSSGRMNSCFQNLLERT